MRRILADADDTPAQRLPEIIRSTERHNHRLEAMGSSRRGITHRDPTLASGRRASQSDGADSLIACRPSSCRLTMFRLSAWCRRMAAEQGQRRQSGIRL